MLALADADSDSLAYVSADCREIVQTRLGLDWASFGEIAHQFKAPATRAELVLAGAIVASTPGLGSETEWLAADAPPSLAAFLRGDLAGERRGDDVAHAWFDLLGEMIVSTRYDPWITRDSGAWMAYGDGTLVVGDVGDADWEEGGSATDALTALAHASFLMHEASHGVVPGHVPCEDDPDVTCDATVDGAYGVQAWWLTSWLTAYEWDVSEETRILGYTLRYYACERIEDHDGFEPCGG